METSTPNYVCCGVDLLKFCVLLRDVWTDEASGQTCKGFMRLVLNRETHVVTGEGVNVHF